ncbi:Vegetative incompatibility protein HET-E-1 [Madurella mycetomatis]|uniref:Vegetative incompatibility protein HET-E-1 n=1 Tax=Madurella mycetomatis TaxID=100816 RepID=A0A175WD25_9PEZI|nr:Vegetative incompatibility protein HET-E-1 [Madurella mycetomatis]
MPNQPLSRKDYSIGWICALGHELTAATAMLDSEEHPTPPIPATDINAYTLGSMGGHNVVIAGLPINDKGSISSAMVAIHMKCSFPGIKIILIVGIAGSATKEVRLGDVVVSKQVVQWDSGKYEKDGRFQHSGDRKDLPFSVGTQLAKLKTKLELFGNRIPDYLAGIARKFPDLGQEYTDSSMLEDVLFKSEYLHVDGRDDCRRCDRAVVVERTPRPVGRRIAVHYGLIASGNQVIKDAPKRDEINKLFGGDVFCLEMEAAGLIGSIPWVVIRGISDYADSHKNDKWQKYAAAVAAAYAREFLALLPEHELEEKHESKTGGVDESAIVKPRRGADIGVKDTCPPRATGKWNLRHTLCKARVFSIALSHDSKLVAAGVGDTVRLWDTATGEPQKTPEVTNRGGIRNAVVAVAFSHDSKLLAWALDAEEWSIEFWNTATGRRKAIPSKFGHGKIELWDVETGRLRSTLEGHRGGVSSVAFSCDSKLMASGSTDGNIRLWDTWTGQLRKMLAGYHGLCSVAFLSDPMLISSGMARWQPNNIQVWDTKTGKLEQAIQPLPNCESEIVSILAISHGSKVFVSASKSRGGGVRIWEDLGYGN